MRGWCPADPSWRRWKSCSVPSQAVTPLTSARSIRRSLKRLVESHGIEADTFSSGLEFTDLVENMASFDPQCVILDMHMPGLNGVQVLQRLAKTKPSLPVIFLTGTRDPYTFQLALTSGAVAALHKPVADSVLIANLRTILKMETREEK